MSSNPLRLLKRALLVVAAAVALPYCFGPIYHFPEPRPFAGTVWLNPYQELQGRWQRANLHAHSRAWGGLTNGQQPADEVVRRYRELGYTVPGVSNYHHIAAFDGVDTLPLYEHGYNIVKRHQVAVGARRVVWFDLLLWQSLSQQQYIIDRVHAAAELVALSHPPTRDAYAGGGLHYLTGYELIEVANGPHTAEAPWDAALSSGRPVWAVGNDDTHDLNDPQRLAVAWTMIDAATPKGPDVYAALRAGRAYVVQRRSHGRSLAGQPVMDTAVERVEVRDGTLVVESTGTPARFTFIGQNGTVRKTVDRTRRAEYALAPDDTYVRAVVDSPTLAIFLNPVLRTDGNGLTAPRATVDAVRTWLLRAALLAVLAIAILWRRRSHRRASAPRTDTTA